MKRITNVLLPAAISVVALTTVLSGCAWVGSVDPLPPCAAATASESGSDQVSTRIELAHGDRVATAVLEDSAAARSLLDQLPMTIQLRDSFGLAMVSEVSPGLETGGASISCSFVVGEIAYSPEDKAIAIFHSPDTSQLATPGVVRLGTITDGLAGITAQGRGPVTIRRVG